MLQASSTAASSVLLPEVVKTQSSVSEDGRNYCTKHAELIKVIYKLSLLHLVGYLYYYIYDERSHKHLISRYSSLVKVVTFIQHYSIRQREI